MGAIQVAANVAELCGYRAAYTEKTSEGTMSFNRFESELEDIRSIILVEDVLTTGSTTKKTILTLKAVNLFSKIEPVIGTLINRTGAHILDFEELGKFKIKSVVDVDFEVWEPKACPLCAKGSVAIKPKLDWNSFIGKERG